MLLIGLVRSCCSVRVGRGRVGDGTNQAANVVTRGIPAQHPKRRIWVGTQRGGFWGQSGGPGQGGLKGGPVGGLVDEGDHAGERQQRDQPLQLVPDTGVPSSEVAEID